MAYNFLNTELLRKHVHSDHLTDYDIGQWTKRNGVDCMAMQPYPFYLYYVTDPSKYIGAGLFKPNTSYIFDIWIDTDDIFYGKENRNVPGGLQVVYTNGEKIQVIATGSIDNPKGFQHVRFVSDKSKSIAGYIIYYYTNTSCFYRYDSYIIEDTLHSFNKNGITDCGFYTETDTNTVSMIKCGGVYTSDIIEY